MLIDGTLSNNNMQKLYEIPISKLKIYVRIAEEKKFCPLSGKPIVSPIFGNCTISFVFLKIFSQRLKICFNIMIDFSCETLWIPFSHKLVQQPGFFGENLIYPVATNWYRLPNQHETMHELQLHIQ